jgi:hypothetical protein
MPVADPLQSDGQTAAQATLTPPADPKVGTSQPPQQQQAPQQTQQQPQQGSKPGEPQQVVQPPKGAPDKYEFKAPQGMELVASADTLKQFSDVARGLNLTQEQAQKTLDQLSPMFDKAWAGQLQARIQQTRTEWAEKARTDPVFGGVRLAENTMVADKALARFGDEELSSLLKESGLWDHPALKRVFLKVGRAISEDGFVPATKPVTDKDVAHRLNPHLK